MKKTTKKTSVGYKILVVVIVLISASLGFFFIYKHTVIKNDKKMFEDAESKLRQLDLPKSDKISYEKFCNYKGSKDIIKTKPSCSVVRVDKYKAEQNSIDLTKSIYEKLISQGGYANKSLSSGIDIKNLPQMSEAQKTIKLSTMNRQYDCSSGFLELLDNQQFTYTSSCSKVVKFQLYPEY